MQRYRLPEIFIKTQKVIQSCITFEQLQTALKFKQLANNQLHDQEICALHAYFMCKAHSLGYRGGYFD